MNRLKICIAIALIYNMTLISGELKKETPISGKKVFETYCWGCHHQSAVAFGPPFTRIASKRNKQEIRAMISDPKSVSKLFGYKRNAMPAFTLSEKELNAITEYIISYKPKEK